MKPIEIEGIRLTEEMIQRIQYLQLDNGEGTGDYLKLIDQVIRFIAVNANEGMGDNGKIEALAILCELSLFRQMFSIFSGKEDQS